MNRGGLRETVESRAFSMQRVISNVSAGLYNNQRVNSVNKDMNMEITTIEEITVNPSKPKKGRHNADKKEGKGDRTEHNLKKDHKSIKSKYMDKKANENTKLKSDKSKLLDSDEENHLKNSSSHLHTPVQRNDKVKEKNHLVKVKKLSTLESSEKEALRKNLNKNNNDINRVDNISRTKDQMKFYLDKEKSEKLIINNLENKRFYKTEQNILGEFQTKFKETDNNFGKKSGAFGQKANDKSTYSSKTNYSGVKKIEDKGKARRNERNQFRENVNYNQIDVKAKETPDKYEQKPSTNNSQRYIKNQKERFDEEGMTLSDQLAFIGVLKSKNIAIEVCGDDIIRSSFEPKSSIMDSNNELSNIHKHEEVDSQKEKFVNSIPEIKDKTQKRVETKLRKPTDFKTKEQFMNKNLMQNHNDSTPSIVKSTSEKPKKINKMQSQIVAK